MIIENKELLVSDNFLWLTKDEMERYQYDGIPRVGKKLTLGLFSFYEIDRWWLLIKDFPDKYILTKKDSYDSDEYIILTVAEARHSWSAWVRLKIG